MADPGATSTTLDLAPNLVTVNDLPDGWTLAQSAPGSVGSIEQLGACPMLRFSLKDPNANAVYAGGQNGPFISETVLQPPDDGPTLALDKARAAVTSCKTFTSAGITYHLASLAFARIGQDSTALRMTATVKGAKLVSDIVVFRASGAVGVITATGTNPDMSVLLTLAQQAAKNFVD